MATYTQIDFKLNTQKINDTRENLNKNKISEPYIQACNKQIKYRLVFYDFS